ncbi:hypothetical protein [Arthrobacter sp. JSM 101049]|uniref:hypothetical protein n=1 Tax=Arthrobacter sp. JSM 101049 TaxID=929097 RepID=UPI003567931B
MTERREQIQPDVNLGKAAVYFLVMGVLGLLAGTVATLWAVIGGILTAIGLLIGALWFMTRKRQPAARD